MHYLFNTYGEDKDVFLPKSPADKGRADEWSYFAMMELDAVLYTIRRHKFLSEIYGEAPVAVTVAGEYCQKQIAAVAPAIAKADPYLFGDKISAADILLSTTLDFAERYEVQLPQPCRSYRDRALARTAFLTAKARNEDLNVN